MNRTVTEADFRKSEFINAKVDDYEFDGTGELVRKDRFWSAIRAIADTLELDTRKGWQCSQIVNIVDEMYKAILALNVAPVPPAVRKCLEVLQSYNSSVEIAE